VSNDLILSYEYFLMPTSLLVLKLGAISTYRPLYINRMNQFAELAVIFAEVIEFRVNKLAHRKPIAELSTHNWYWKALRI
jgi:hypothetical protein